MASDLEVWARIEREFLREDVKALRAGTKLIAPGGDDITTIKPIELELRSKHAQVVLDGIDRTHGSKARNGPPT